MAITAFLFFCLSLFLFLFLFRLLYQALLKQGKNRDENRATKRFKSCDSEERAEASKKSRTQDVEKEEEEVDLQFPATKLHQQTPFPDPDSGVGSSSNCEGSSSSSSSNKKFEVFISHRGPDTKRTLAHHLYDLLRVQGVEAFFDKAELQSGERFPLAIQEAIACSKVDVCILSSGYAESEWCLRELQMMVEKYEMGKSKLIPIFYDVKPCDVRHLQGAFGQGFQKKIIDKNRYSTELIHKWRQALYKIADIRGEEGKGECCMAIVNKILQELDVGLLAIPNNVVGRQEKVLSVKQKIMKCSQNGYGVTSVEITGIGGIGKTTFAKQLYNKICPHYRRCCFIEDVGRLVEKNGVNEVHIQLLSNLFRYDANANNSRMEGKKLLMNRLQNTEILVVFDNIHSKIPLSAVFIEDDVSLNPRSIIIVTSREKNVLKHDPRVALYCEQNLIPVELSNLDYHESNELFCQYAFKGTGNVMNEFDELRKSIIEKCHGIPLALILLGSQLYRREIKFWKNLWNSLKDSLHPDLKKILKISYDNLDTELEKCLFLDVATFLLLEKEDLLVKLRQSDGDESESEILLALETLKTKNLIEENYGRLKMHDLLVDLGRSLVKDEDSCPGRRSRVWHPLDVKNMLSNEEMGTNKVKALSLVWRGSAVLNDDGCPWPADAFRKLSSLEFLILQGPCIEGDLSKLSKRISWLRWTDFPYKYIPVCIKHVKVLQLIGERLTLLWEHEEDAPTYLRQLSLSNCMNLKRLPKFTAKFRHLSCIELKKCTSLESIPDSFGQLQALKHLQLMDCFKIKSLPESFGKLLQLQELAIYGCPTLQCLPESFGQLLQLRKLDIYLCKALECLPESFGQLLQLRKLNIYRCKALKCLPESFGTLSRLETLEMSDCLALQCLPESFGQLLQLRKLNIYRCKALKCLPESFGTLSRLETLEMSNCLALQCLPESFGQLLQLRKLNISWCEALECLPESFGTLSRLETLKMECPALQCLPESFGQLLQLRILNIYLCKALECLPESFGTLSRLETLEMRNCLALQCLPDSFGKLLRLRKLRIHECKALKCLPKSFGHLRQLEDLSITRCHGLEELPESSGDLMNLLKLEVYAGHKMRFSVEQFQRLQHIHDLRISKYKDNISCGKTSHTEQQNIDCWKNSNRYGQATQHQHLISLVRNVSQCPRVKSQNRDAADLVLDNSEHAPPQFSDVELIANHFLALFESGSHMLQQAQALSLNGFWNLQELPQGVGNLGHLKRLELYGWANLQRLPDSVIGSLSSLQILRLHNCWNLEELPDIIGNLQNLRILDIEDCIVLKGLRSWLGNISSLTTLVVNYCWMVEVIHMQGLVNLDKLEVIGCINLRSIIGLSVLPNLSELTIKGCLNLRDLAVTCGCATFNSLKWLCICGCYQLCLPNKGLVEHLPDQLRSLELSLNHDSVEASLDEENQTLPNILRWYSNARTRTQRVLNVKTSPLLFEAVKKRVTDLLSTKDDCFHSFHELSHVHSKDTHFDSYFFHGFSHETPERSPIRVRTAVLCFVSAVYAVDFPMHIPPPEIPFFYPYSSLRRFDFGEEIHIVKHTHTHHSEPYLIKIFGDSGESYEALVKEGWLILLDADDTGLLTEIYNIFCSELIKQRWLSRAWTELPSQLCISEFSALDIANCQITKTSRHFNTYIMEEESGLTWKRRRCLFTDDHALLMGNPRRNSSKHGLLAYIRLRKNSSKHGALAYTGLHLDLEAGAVANLYEMSISVSGKGKLNSRKLQELVSINWQEIPVSLNTLLRTNASDSTIAALHKRKSRTCRFNIHC